MKLHLSQIFDMGVVRITLHSGDDEIASYNLELPAHDGDIAEAVERIASEAEDHGVHLRGAKKQGLFRAIAMGSPI